MRPWGVVDVIGGDAVAGDDDWIGHSVWVQLERVVVVGSARQVVRERPTTSRRDPRIAGASSTSWTCHRRLFVVVVVGVALWLPDCLTSTDGCWP